MSRNASKMSDKRYTARTSDPVDGSIQRDPTIRWTSASRGTTWSSMATTRRPSGKLTVSVSPLLNQYDSTHSA